MNECSGSFRDKLLDGVVDKVAVGIDELKVKYPGIPDVKVSSGLRGTRYFIEFPIIGPNVDAFSLLSSTQQLMDKAKKNPKYNFKTVKTDSYLNEDRVCYLIDYLVKSEEVGGTTNSGSCYIRGQKGEIDNFKFILEKANGFSDCDSDLVVNAYE